MKGGMVYEAFFWKHDNSFTDSEIDALDIDFVKRKYENYYYDFVPDQYLDDLMQMYDDGDISLTPWQILAAELAEIEIMGKKDNDYKLLGYTCYFVDKESMVKWWDKKLNENAN